MSHGVEPLCDWIDALGGAAQARANGAAGSADLARRALAALPAGPAAARARLELALSRDGGVTAEERVAALEEALRSAPPAARGALERRLADARSGSTERRPGPAPAPLDGKEAAPTGADRLERAWQLLSLGKAVEAQEELARASDPPAPADPPRLALARAFAAFALGRVAEAGREAAPLAGSADPVLRRGAQLILARVASREHRVPEAIAAWRAVAESSAPIPGLPNGALATLRDDAAYFAAWLHFDAGDFDRAASELARYARQRPASRRAEDARWFSAWALVRKGAAGEADAALRRLENGALNPRVRYWRARVAADPSEGIALLRSVVAAEPVGYYALLACMRLAERGERCPAPALGTGRPGAAPPDPERDAEPLRAALLLASLGLREEALAELQARLASAGGRRLAPAAAELAAFLGDPLVPFRVSRDRLGLSRRTLPWSFPEPWPHLVDRAAAAAAVDPALLRAVMRRESGYEPGIRSQAGAVGLLQLIPPTAARLSALLQLPAEPPPRLEDPATNIPLGTTYLSLLLERFGSPVLALAAYNAGPAAVDRWLRDRGDLPLDAWVESIPYRETRQYVRAVIENWVGARLAAGGAPPELDLAPRGRPKSSGIAF